MGIGKLDIGTNNSQFFITFRPLTAFNTKHVAFGKLAKGLATLGRIEGCGGGSGSMKKNVVIVDCGVFDADLLAAKGEFKIGRDTSRERNRSSTSPRRDRDGSRDRNRSKHESRGRDYRDRDRQRRDRDRRSRSRDRRRRSRSRERERGRDRRSRSRERDRRR